MSNTARLQTVRTALTSLQLQLTRQIAFHDCFWLNSSHFCVNGTALKVSKILNGYAENSLRRPIFFAVSN